MPYIQLPRSLFAAGGFFVPPSNLFSSPWSAQLSLALSKKIGLLAILVRIASVVMWSRGTGVAVRLEMGVSMSAKGSKHKDYEVRIKLEYSDSRF